MLVIFVLKRHTFLPISFEIIESAEHHWLLMVVASFLWPFRTYSVWMRRVRDIVVNMVPA